MSDGPVVFWDFDGTLAARSESWSVVLREAVLTIDPTSVVSGSDLDGALAHGFPQYGPEGLRLHSSAAAWWAATSPVLRDACTAAGVDRVVADRAVLRVPDIYYRSDTWQLLPGAGCALESTAGAGFRNVILSNHAPELPRLVHQLGLARYVERTLTSASLGVEKPDLMAFQLALRISRAAPDSWMIGDNPVTDVAGARAAGLRALLVHRTTQEMPARSLVSAAAEVIEDDPRTTVPIR